MDDQSQHRFNEALEYLGVFEEGLTRLSQDPNSTELHGEIGEFWVLAKTACDAIGRPDLADCSDGIQALLDATRESSAASEEAIAQLSASVAGMRSLLMDQQKHIAECSDEAAVGTIFAKIQAEVDALSPDPVGTSVVEENDFSQALDHELHLREVTADDLERALSKADFEVVSSSNAPLAAPIVLDSAPALQTLERPLRPGEVSLDELERAFRETEVEVEVVAPLAPQPEKRAAPIFIPPKSGADKPAADVEIPEADKIANQSIRVNVDTLEPNPMARPLRRGADRSHRNRDCSHCRQFSRTRAE